MADVKNAHLQNLSLQIEKHIDATRQMFAMYNPAQLNWKPDHKNWSVAQCIDHIIIADQQYFKNIKKAIDQTITGALTEKKPYRPGFIARFSIYAQRPGFLLKFKTPLAFRPSVRTEGKKILEDFILHEQELLVLIKKCDGWDINTIKLHSPVHSHFKFSLGECFSILVTHQERHLHQARSVSQRVEFPKGIQA
ncbi:DinB family protein [bacterium]|nr:MAG: DinB family protein [bacterium]